MASAKSAIRNLVIKPLGAAAQMTIGGTVTASSSVLDLQATGQTHGKFSFARFCYVGVKTGTGGTGALYLTPYTGTTSSPATALTRFPITTVGTDVNHGYSPASTTVITNYVDVDLTDSEVKQYMKVTASVTGSAGTDTTDGYFFVILGGTRELPQANTAALTTA